MAIKQVEIIIGGMPHTVQVNDEDKVSPSIVEGQKPDDKPGNVTAKGRTPANKASKPDADK